MKLPKVKQILQRYHDLAKDQTKETCAQILVEEVKDVWRLHFGLRVIDGKEFAGQVVPDSEKIMINRDDLIQTDLLRLEKQYHDMEYESRRKKKGKNFLEKEIELENTPFNILKVGMWRTMTVGEVKRIIWLPLGEEILSRSGIFSWQEDLDHLTNQLTSAQPGHCKSLDIKQAQRDLKKLRYEHKQDEKRKEESRRKKESFKVNFEDDETYQSDQENLHDEDFPVKEVSRKKRKNGLMGLMSEAADRANLSFRDMALMGAAAAKSMGLKVLATNCSVMTAHRQRTNRTNKLAEEIRTHGLLQMLESFTGTEKL